MSTLSGQASKGEKTKQKFQSLDINSLYRVSRGENLEKQQQKSSSIYIKHGMQSLGKVPNARRAPANLPSLKAEHSGTDAAVPLVPPGAPGWGKQDASQTTAGSQQQPPNAVAATTSPTAPQMPNAGPNNAPPQNVAQQPSVPMTSHQAAIALPVTNTIPSHNKQLTPSAQPAPGDKLWSSVMSGGQDVPHPPLYQSPQFQHEFPSLSCGDGGPTRTGSDAQYPSGLSLRPQTEGSWTQGGQRPGAAEATGPPRPGSVPPGAPPQLSGQAGLPPQQQQPFPPQIRGVMPPFMCKGSNFQQGSGVGIQNQNTPSPVNGRGGASRQDNRPPRLADRDRDIDEIMPRPIIKDEELSRMAEISKDMGWADSDEIDYNQKLAFSDDESDKPMMKKEPKKIGNNQQQQVRDGKDAERNDVQPNDGQQRHWSGSRASRGRSSEEEDIWSQRRSQADKEMEIVVQRAKQRKEEEEKRFNQERKQGAAKKLMELEEKIQKRDRDNQEGVGTINPSNVPPKPINHVDIPLPEFQKDKERDKDIPRDRDNRSRTPNEQADGKNQSGNQGNSFRHLTQIEGKNFPRKHQKQSENRDRDRNARENGASFSKQFQNDLPPRFLKHQRNNSNSNVQGQQQYHQFDNNRWVQGQSPPKPPQPLHVRNLRQDSPEIEREIEDDRRDYLRQGSDDSYRSGHHLQQEMPQKAQEGRYDELQDNRHQMYDQQYARRDREEEKWQKDKEDPRHIAYEQQYSRRERDDEKWQKEKEDRWHKDKERQEKKQEEHQARPGDDWGDKRDKARDEKPLDRYERDRPQRPDSRDSRSTRHSRDSEPRDYMGSWAETAYEPPYEEKAHFREDRRTVPGPITKDRIEADDMRSEKRNLTQLKRGQPVVVKSEMKKEDKDESDIKKDTQIGTWADSIPPALEEAQNKFEEEKKAGDSHKPDPRQFGEPPKKLDKVDDYKDRNRGRQHSGNKGWGSGPNDYHSSRGPSWQKRPPSRGHKSGRPGLEYHGTDSDGSMEDHSADKNDQKGDQKFDSRDQRSPKPSKRLEKDEKNRDNKQEKSLGDQRKQEKSEKKDNYVPRGEPSRHGRGGGNFRSGRMGGLGKRIDGYGPPPSKSPFGHHEDKEKKAPEDVFMENAIPTEDKTKQNQQALAAGIIGKPRIETGQSLEDKNKVRGKPDIRKNKPRGKDEVCDTNSENSDEKDKKDGRSKMPDRKMQGVRPQNSNRGRNNPPRLGGEKRSYDPPRGENTSRQNSNNSLKKEDKLTDQNILANAIADISLKNREDGEPVEDKDDKASLNGDSEGFQEVKSKKTVKERQKSLEDKQQVKPVPKNEPNKDSLKSDRDRKPKAAQLTQQQIQNIPSLMATPVNPPPVLPQPKSQFDRPRQSKLAPRFAKQKLQKAQMQQQVHGLCDVGDLNKVNQSMNVYGMKEAVTVPAPVSSCAWDKPLGPQLRNMEHDGMLGVAIESVKGLEQAQQSSQGASPNEKMMGKPTLQDKALLDGTTPPVNTIIFENTNFKSAPGARNPRPDKPRPKLEEGAIDTSVMTTFNKPTMNELLQSKNDSKSEPIQLPLFKEDSADMKLDFFGSDLQFTDDKGAKTLMSKSIHAITSGNNTVDSLDIKIASVKKVWETSEQEGEENQISFGGPPLDSNVFNQGKDTPDDNHEGYSPSPNQTASTTTNVCKVKPTQQVSGSGQTVLSSTSHQPHSGIVAPGLMGNPLSPPPMTPVLGASVGIGPQQYTANQHIGYQAGLSGSTQFGMSAIPSPPTVPLVYNSTQQLQAAAQSAGLYGAFQIDQTGVLGGQGRSQFSQYPNYHGLGQTASSPYSTQSVYLQTAPPHPPPQAQAPPELYPNMSNYRLSATAPFGQSQQLNNPTTVLISSTSNSLMSASVKPSSQPISAIGTKAGGVGQAYQQQSQQGQQVYMAYDPSIQAANYLPPSAGVMQRGPSGPVQNNVVPGLQPSSSFYSGSTGGQTGYFQQPGSSTMPSAQLQQHQAGYGLQGNVFGTHSQSHTNTGLQNYSPFLPTSLQMAAALNAQQFRSGMPAAYMKSVGSQQIGDQSGRPQQLKSPSSQEVLSSVFNSGPQIPSPKSRQNCKHPPPQSSPTAQHKYNLYQGVGGQQNPNIQRYPAPIQRPMNFQQMQQSNTVNQKHRNNANNKAPNRQYYGGQNNSLSSQNEKVEDPKMSDSVALSSANAANNSNKATIGTSPTVTVNAASEKVKDNIKEETAALKD